MPRPRGRRHGTAKGVDPVVPPGPSKATEKDLDERERRQSSRRKAPGPPRKRKAAPAKDRQSDVPPTDPV